MPHRASTPRRAAALGTGALVALALVAGTAAPAGMEPRSLTLQLDCESPPEPGRVRCSVQLRPQSGQRLSWADVLVVESSAFVRPLRSRVRAELTPDGSARAALALVATQRGRFQVVLRGRAVVCTGGEQGAHCRPATREASVEVRIGG